MSTSKLVSKKVRLQKPQIGWSLFKIFIFNWLGLLYITFPILSAFNINGGDSRVFWLGSTFITLAVYCFLIAIGRPTANVREEFVRTKIFRLLRVPAAIAALLLPFFGLPLVLKAVKFDLPVQTIAYLAYCNNYVPLGEVASHRFPLMSVERVVTAPGTNWKSPFHSIILQPLNGTEVIPVILKLNKGNAREINLKVNWTIVKEFESNFYTGRSTSFGAEDISLTLTELCNEFCFQFADRDITNLKIPAFIKWIEPKLAVNYSGHVKFEVSE